MAANSTARETLSTGEAREHSSVSMLWARIIASVGMSVVFPEVYREIWKEMLAMSSRSSAVRLVRPMLPRFDNIKEGLRSGDCSLTLPESPTTCRSETGRNGSVPVETAP